MTTKARPLCQHCFHTLVPVGDRRKGGTRRHDDWDTRAYHKQCWKYLPQAEQDRVRAEQRILNDVPQAARIYIFCQYKDRYDVKALGAKWDPNRRMWYAPDETLADRLVRAGYDRCDGKPASTAVPAPPPDVAVVPVVAPAPALPEAIAE